MRKNQLGRKRDTGLTIIVGENVLKYFVNWGIVVGIVLVLLLLRGDSYKNESIATALAVAKGIIELLRLFK